MLLLTSKQKFIWTDVAGNTLLDLSGLAKQDTSGQLLSKKRYKTREEYLQDYMKSLYNKGEAMICSALQNQNG
jgi:hypothetical protein